MPKYQVDVRGPGNTDVTHLTVDTDIANGSVKTSTDKPSDTFKAVRNKVALNAASAAKSRLVAQNAVKYREKRDENIMARATNEAKASGKLWNPNKNKAALELQRNKIASATLKANQKKQITQKVAANIDQKGSNAEAHRIAMNTAKTEADMVYNAATKAEAEAQVAHTKAEEKAKKAEDDAASATANPAMAKMSGQHTENKVTRATGLREMAKTSLARKLTLSLQRSKAKMDADLAAARLKLAEKKKYVIDATKMKIMTRRAAINAPINSKNKNALVDAAKGAVDEMRRAEEEARIAELNVEELYRKTPNGLANERGAVRRDMRSTTEQALSNSQIDIEMDNNTNPSHASNMASAFGKTQGDTLPVVSTMTRGGTRKHSTHRKQHTCRKHIKKGNQSKKRK